MFGIIVFQAYGQDIEEFKCSDCAHCCIDHESCGDEEECEQKYALTLIVAISLVFAGLLLFVYFQTRGNNECCDIDCLRRTFKVKDIENQHHIGGIFGVEDEDYQIPEIQNMSEGEDNQTPINIGENQPMIDASGAIQRNS